MLPFSGLNKFELARTTWVAVMQYDDHSEQIPEPLGSLFESLGGDLGATKPSFLGVQLKHA